MKPKLLNIGSYAIIDQLKAKITGECRIYDCTQAAKAIIFVKTTHETFQFIECLEHAKQYETVETNLPIAIIYDVASYGRNTQ